MDFVPKSGNLSFRTETGFVITPGFRTRETEDEAVFGLEGRYSSKKSFLAGNPAEFGSDDAQMILMRE
jgi:hypothetical protein